MMMMVVVMMRMMMRMMLFLASVCVTVSDVRPGPASPSLSQAGRGRRASLSESPEPAEPGASVVTQ